MSGAWARLTHWLTGARPAPTAPCPHAVAAAIIDGLPARGFTRVGMAWDCDMWEDTPPPGGRPRRVLVRECATGALVTHPDAADPYKTRRVSSVNAADAFLRSL